MNFQVALAHIDTRISNETVHRFEDTKESIEYTIKPSERQLMTKPGRAFLFHQ
jgi:hypothetical protein